MGIWFRVPFNFCPKVSIFWTLPHVPSFRPASHFPYAPTDTRLKQEEERRKREELERIVEENNKKIEEAQRKLVSWLCELLNNRVTWLTRLYF